MLRAVAPRRRRWRRSPRCWGAWTRDRLAPAPEPPVDLVERIARRIAAERRSRGGRRARLRLGSRRRGRHGCRRGGRGPDRCPWAARRRPANRGSVAFHSPPRGRLGEGGPDSPSVGKRDQPPGGRLQARLVVPDVASRRRRRARARGLIPLRLQGGEPVRRPQRRCEARRGHRDRPAGRVQDLRDAASVAAATNDRRYELTTTADTRRRRLSALAVVAITLVGGFATAAGCGGGDDDAATPAAATGADTTTEAQGGNSDASTIDLSETDFELNPSDPTVPARGGHHQRLQRWRGRAQHRSRGTERGGRSWSQTWSRAKADARRSTCPSRGPTSGTAPSATTGPRAWRARSRSSSPVVSPPGTDVRQRPLQTPATAVARPSRSRVA